MVLVGVGVNPEVETRMGNFKFETQLKGKTEKKKPVQSVSLTLSFNADVHTTLQPNSEICAEKAQ